MTTNADLSTDVLPGMAAAIACSIGLSLLMLAVPLFGMQVYDRVLGSGHVETLVLLCVIGLIALAALAGLEAVRTSLLSRVGIRFEAALIQPLLEGSIRQGVPGGQRLRDLTTVRQCLTGPVIVALFDLLWVPLAILVLAVLDGWLALFACASVVALLGLATLGALVTGRAQQGAGQLQLDAQVLAEATGRKAEVVRALGMSAALRDRIRNAHIGALLEQGRSDEHGGIVLGITRAVRLATQCGVIALGAWLVLRSQLTPGGMLASSILLSKALAPVEQLVSTWRILATARESWGRLRSALQQVDATPERTALPAPLGDLVLKGVCVSVDGRDLLRDIDFAVRPGQCLAIVGASGSGKTTLCRVLAGLIEPSAGVVRLHGACLQHYREDELGRSIGYLPQDPMLFAATVRTNIARMQPDAPDTEVVAAAQLAGTHEMILGLPEGYDTRLADGGAPLSGGQRQRLGLARALFGQPRLVILDEPNSHLDTAGDDALAAAVARLKSQGVTVVLATHRPQALQQADLLLVMENGKVGRFGPREQVMAKFIRPARAA